MSGMIASHHEPDNLLCEVCGKILGSVDTFKRHLNLHVEHTSNQWPCGTSHLDEMHLEDISRHHSNARHHTKVSTNKYKENT